MPIRSASATVSATSGPASVKMRRKDFGFAIELGRNDLEVRGYISGIGPHAGSFSTINRGRPAAVKATVKYRISRLLLWGRGRRWPQRNCASSPASGKGERTCRYRPRSRSSTSEVAKPSAGAPIEAWKPRRASRVWPPNWPSGVPL